METFRITLTDSTGDTYEMAVTMVKIDGYFQKFKLDLERGMTITALPDEDPEG